MASRSEDNTIEAEVTRDGHVTIKFLDEEVPNVYRENKQLFIKNFKEYIESNNLPIRSLKFIAD